MSDVRRKYDEDFKKNAVKLSYASSKSVAEVARDLGISNGMLYRWRQKYTAEGDKTRFATLEEENKALRLKNAEQAIEIDMLKKASAYFASLHK
ncbi:MAG: transposase [Desulfobulbus sp.]|nr:transposase [Desulfobulbus sp.]